MTGTGHAPKQGWEAIHRHFAKVLQLAGDERSGGLRQIGAELKFPLVTEDGTAPASDVVPALWEHLCARDWEPVRDDVTGQVVGARNAADGGFTVASCETGYCKPEFALAPVTSLGDLESAISALRDDLAPYAEKQRVHFLGYGIQPVTAPSMRLAMDKSRTRVWDQVFRSNRIVPPTLGHDLHLFTVNAASHVHVSVAEDEAVPLVNVLNGFAGPQIAMTANSAVWRGQVDPVYRCVAEKFWDWWIPDEGRVGIPPTPFADLRDYARVMAAYRPAFVRRPDGPLLIDGHETFGHYFAQEHADAVGLDGEEAIVEPVPADIDLHCTCVWHAARITRYGTVENRPNDQQPPMDLAGVAALTLGLTEALPEALEELSGQDWRQLRTARESACRLALRGTIGVGPISAIAGRLLEMAHLGLERRGLGEERLLEPFAARVRERRSPSDDAAALFERRGAEALVEERALV